MYVCVYSMCHGQHDTYISSSFPEFKKKHEQTAHRSCAVSVQLKILFSEAQHLYNIW